MRNSSKRVDVNSRIGLIKGNQEIIEFINYLKNGRHLYKIKCNYCGNQYESTIENFRDIKKSGKACKKCSNEQNREYSLMSMSDSQIGLKYSDYKSRAKYKKWDFSLSKEEFKYLIFSNCHYCNQEPNKCKLDRVKGKREREESFLSNGIDRIDSDKGYVLENCLPCCEDCNKAKRNLSYEQFLDLVKRIYEFKIKQ